MTSIIISEVTLCKKIAAGSKTCLSIVGRKSELDSVTGKLKLL